MSIQAKKQELIELISQTDNETTLDWVTKLLHEQVIGYPVNSSSEYKERYLLRRINQGLEEYKRQRLVGLMGKAEREELTIEETEEYRILSEEAEIYQANRLLFLRELSILRGVSVAQVMTDLGIQPTGDIL